MPVFIFLDVRKTHSSNLVADSRSMEESCSKPANLMKIPGAACSRHSSTGDCQDWLSLRLGGRGVAESLPAMEEAEFY